MNRYLGPRISFHWLWLLHGGSVTTGRFDFSASLKTREKQKQPPSVELETQCIDVGKKLVVSTLLIYIHFSKLHFKRQLSGFSQAFAMKSTDSNWIVEKNRHKIITRTASVSSLDRFSNDFLTCNIIFILGCGRSSVIFGGRGQVWRHREQLINYLHFNLSSADAIFDVKPLKIKPNKI